MGREEAFRRIYRVWCGVEPLLRHGSMKQPDTFGGLILIPITRSVLFLSSAVWNMSSRKRRVFVLFCFCLLLLCQPALLDTFLVPCVVVVFFPFFCWFFFLPGVVCFISQAIWLVSESNSAPVSPRAPPLSSQTYSHSHISPNWHAAFTLQTNQFCTCHTWNTAAKCGSSLQPLKMCRLFFFIFLVHWGLGRPDPDSPTSLCLAGAHLHVQWGQMGADGGRFGWEQSPTLSPHRSGSRPCLH